MTQHSVLSEKAHLVGTALSVARVASGGTEWEEVLADTNVTAGHIPVRETDGQLAVPTTPTAGKAASKNYVDSLTARSFNLPVVYWDTLVTEGDGKYYFRAPFAFKVIGVGACCIVAGTQDDAETFTIQLRKSPVGGGGDVDVLSTPITIDSTEKDSSTAATPAVINTDNDDFVEGDLLIVDNDDVFEAVVPQGLIVSVVYQ